MGLFDFLKPKKKNTSFGIQGSVQEELNHFIFASKAKEMYFQLIEKIKNSPQASTNDEIDGGIGEFGLEISNPVPIKTILSNEIYLKQLQTSTGREISWERSGSCSSNNINHEIDKYQIFCDGKYVIDIYLSPYHYKTSNKAPKGFKIIS